MFKGSYNLFCYILNQILLSVYHKNTFAELFLSHRSFIPLFLMHEGICEHLVHMAACISRSVFILYSSTN